METKEKVQTAVNVFWFIAAIQGAILGFKAGFGAGLFMLVTTISPVVTGLVYWVTLGQVNLAQIGLDFYNTTVANTAIPGLVLLVALAVICYAILAGYVKIITMFSRM